MAEEDVKDITGWSRDDINAAINSGDNVYSNANLDEQTEKMMDFIIACILSKYEKSFSATIYSSSRTRNQWNQSQCKHLL